MAAVPGGAITAKDFASDAEPAKTAPKSSFKTSGFENDDEKRLGISQEQLDLVLALIRKAELEDEGVRQYLLRMSKCYHDYFRGYQDTFWDEVARDWRIPTAAELASVGADNDVMGRIINIVRAHGESLISALGSNPPSARYFPDDADVEADITTAKAYSKLEKLINKHNDGSFLFFKSLFLLYLEGIAFGHNYSDTDESYGTAKVKGAGKKAKVTSQKLVCSTCGHEDLEQSEPEEIQNEQQSNQPALEGIDSEQPEEANENPEEEASETPIEEEAEEAEETTNNDLPVEEVKSPDTQSNSKPCPVCSQSGTESNLEAEGDPFEEEIEISSDDSAPKTREIVNIYGLLNVKFPLYSREQKQGGYLRLAFEENEGLTKEKFPEVQDKIQGIGGQNAGMSYERWARTDSNYLGQVPTDLTTVRVYWFRPWYLNNLSNDTNETDIKALKAKYPKGIKVTVTGTDLVCEICEEALDEHWSVSVDPLCNVLHTDPIVKPVIPIQDVKNDVFCLSVETIEHGIMETFVDSEVLDFDKYGKERAKPGMKYPVKPRAGKTISESFYQDKSANLNEEVGAFNKELDQEAQFVLGSFPSIYGGTQSGGSKTLGEYSMSRAQALQRLGIVWNRVSRFFTAIYSKAVPSLARNISKAEYDEKFVEKQGTSFINTWIKHTELTGKVGEVTPESSEKLPVTWAQRRELYLQLFQLNNPMMMQALMSPQNTPALRDALGLDEIYIPGEDDRDKQYAEFVLLLEGEATQGEDGEQTPSVPVNPWDDHQVEFATCRAFVSSPTGLAYRELKPLGFDNIVAHMNAHQKFLQEQTKGNLPGSPVGAKPESNAQSQVE